MDVLATFTMLAMTPSSKEPTQLSGWYPIGGTGPVPGPGPRLFWVPVNLGFNLLTLILGSRMDVLATFTILAMTRSSEELAQLSRWYPIGAWLRA